jgi:hypothetical protein
MSGGIRGGTVRSVPDAMTGEEFAQAVARELGLPELTEEEIGALLQLASTAAHSSERLAAPLCTYLAGRAGVEQAVAAAQRVLDD